MRLEQTGDPEIATRIRQYEMAYPDAEQHAGADRPERRARVDVFELYGPDSRRPGSYAANCILARRLAERGVRFIQLFHPRLGSAQPPHRSDAPRQCRDTDQPSAALIKDLKQRGMLDDTLVIWGGEFGRGVAGQGHAGQPRVRGATITRAASPCGWPAAASSPASPTARPTSSATTSVENPVHVHDLHATMLHLLGIDHERLTFRLQGLDFRLTGVEPAKVVKGILA